jgi:hypothetical protein
MKPIQTKPGQNYNMRKYGIKRVYSPSDGKFVGEIAWNRRKDNLYWAKGKSFESIDDAKFYLMNGVI